MKNAFTVVVCVVMTACTARLESSTAPNEDLDSARRQRNCDSYNASGRQLLLTAPRATRVRSLAIAL